VISTADPSIVQFIEHARSKDMDHATIRMLLLSAGWKEKDISRALVEQSLDMPVPSPPDIGGAREAFMHLVAFAALYTAVVAGVSLAFSLINLFLPDPAITQYAGNVLDIERAAIRWEIAALVVSLPGLLWLSGLLVKEMRLAPEKVRSPIRRWLTYLTLFLAAISIGVDLMTLIWGALSGELSARFLLKVAAVLGVAGAGFYYYFVSLRLAPEELQASRLPRRFGAGTSLAGAVLVVAGLVWTGTPAVERVRQFDARRVDDLRRIYDETMRLSFGSGWDNPAVPLVQSGPLPPTLDDIARRAVGVRPRIADPETGQRYEYRVTGPTSFELCAVFGQARDDVRDVAWNHPQGPHCYAFDALNPIR
jgi:uncharacterized protein DUF5671